MWFSAGQNKNRNVGVTDTIRPLKYSCCPQSNRKLVASGDVSNNSSGLTTKEHEGKVEKSAYQNKEAITDVCISPNGDHPSVDGSIRQIRHQKKNNAATSRSNLVGEDKVKMRSTFGLRIEDHSKSSRDLSDHQLIRHGHEHHMWCMHLGLSGLHISLQR